MFAWFFVVVVVVGFSVGFFFFGGFYVPLENFSFIWRHHNYLRRAVNVNLC